jgi:hypothetical protein
MSSGRSVEESRVGLRGPRRRHRVDGVDGSSGSFDGDVDEHSKLRGYVGQDRDLRPRSLRVKE